MSDQFDHQVNDYPFLPNEGERDADGCVMYDYCPICGRGRIIREGNCWTCTSCFESKCG